MYESETGKNGQCMWEIAKVSCKKLAYMEMGVKEKL